MLLATLVARFLIASVEDAFCVQKKKKTDLTSVPVSSHTCCEAAQNFVSMMHEIDRRQEGRSLEYRSEAIAKCLRSLPGGIVDTSHRVHLAETTLDLRYSLSLSLPLPLSSM